MQSGSVIVVREVESADRTAADDSMLRMPSMIELFIAPARDQRHHGKTNRHQRLLITYVRQEILPG
jgi:hypothetical protein